MSRDDNPEKIIESVMIAMKKAIGSEETKIVFESSSSAVENLLGADKWGAIKGGL
jgi:hypothetical protein